MNALRLGRILPMGLIGAIAAVVAVPTAEGVLALASVFTRTDETATPISAPNESPAVSTSETFTSPVPPPPDFQERLALREGRGGDVQITLIWDDTNDLDLHCIGPDGYELYPGTKDTQSPTGGMMDLDSNASCYAMTKTPVENIYWPVGRAPTGTYRVYVSVYERCEPVVPHTKYRVTTFANGRRWEVDGTVTHAERKWKQLVTEFTFEQQSPRTTPENAAPASASADSTTVSTKCATRASPLSYGLWAVPVAAFITLGLLAMRNYFVRQKPRLTLAQVAIAGCASIAGFLSIWLGQLIDRQIHSDGFAGVGSAIGWILLAGITVPLVSSSSPKVEVMRKVYFGLLGGILAVAMFFIGTSHKEWMGRALGGIAVGLCSGIAVGTALERRKQSVAHVALNKASQVPTVAPTPLSPKPFPPSISPPVVPVHLNALQLVTNPDAIPRPNPVSPSTPTASKLRNPDECPSCARKNPGREGARHCMICDQTY